MEKTEDLRIRRSRLMLQNAFMDLMRQKDFQAITVQEIADKAMVHRATFYDHFVDKYALFEYAIREQFKSILHRTVVEDFPFNIENLSLLITTTCEFLFALCHSCIVKDQHILPMVQTQITGEIKRIVTSWIQQTAQEGSNSASQELVATIASWGIYGAGYYWSQNGDLASIREFVALSLPSIVASLEPALSADERLLA